MVLSVELKALLTKAKVPDLFTAWMTDMDMESSSDLALLCKDEDLLEDNILNKKPRLLRTLIRFEYDVHWPQRARFTTTVVQPVGRPQRRRRWKKILCPMGWLSGCRMFGVIRTSSTCPVAACCPRPASTAFGAG